MQCKGGHHTVQAAGRALLTTVTAQDSMLAQLAPAFSQNRRSITRTSPRTRCWWRWFWTCRQRVENPPGRPPRPPPPPPPRAAPALTGPGTPGRPALAPPWAPGCARCLLRQQALRGAPHAAGPARPSMHEAPCGEKPPCLSLSFSLLNARHGCFKKCHMLSADDAQDMVVMACQGEAQQRSIAWGQSFQQPAHRGRGLRRGRQQARAAGGAAPRLTPPLAVQL